MSLSQQVCSEHLGTETKGVTARRKSIYRQGAQFPIDLDKEVGGEIILLGAAGLTETEPRTR